MDVFFFNLLNVKNIDLKKYLIFIFSISVRLFLSLYDVQKNIFIWKNNINLIGFNYL